MKTGEYNHESGFLIRIAYASRYWELTLGGKPGKARGTQAGLISNDRNVFLQVKVLSEEACGGKRKKYMHPRRMTMSEMNHS